MFWRERDRGIRGQNVGGGPPIGQVRVLVIGDSGVGKTSLVHLIENGSAIPRPCQTIGCAVSVKHITYTSSGSSSSTMNGDTDRDFFVELWDISGHDRYRDFRSLFYSQINGVILVYDLSQKRTKTSLQKWVAEVAAKGTFSAPLGFAGPYGLPVPYIVIGNKADITTKDGNKGSSGNLVEAARRWGEKHGLLSTSEDLPVTETFPGNSALISAAREARFDKEAMMKFFKSLIRRRYFPDEVAAPSPWSGRPHSSEISSENEIFQRARISKSEVVLRMLCNSVNEEVKLCSLKRYNAEAPLPAQRNLPPPPTLYPQQPVSVSQTYSPPSFAQNASRDARYSRLQRADINV